ncbi:MAG: kinase-like domain-containing protein [Monoraphidium minutum]|nr:MAG: kinase-like domain-containing protein [Monoraphidium minutum]
MDHEDDYDASDDELDFLCGQRPLLPTPQETVCGRFTVLRCLGAGAAGHVFAAIDLCSGDQVALKILAPSDPAGDGAPAPPGASAPLAAGAAAEFGSYWHLGAARGHPGAAAAAASGIPCAFEHGILTAAAAASAPQVDALPPAPGLGADDGAPAGGAPRQGRRHAFLSLQLLGPDLFTLMERGAFGGPEGRALLAEAARSVLKARLGAPRRAGAPRSLEFLHGKGFVHGDVKPENIVAARHLARPAAAAAGGAAAGGGGAQLPASFFLVDLGGLARLAGPGEGGASSGGGGCQGPAWCTPGYASAAALRGAAPAAADDAESLCCVMLWLATGQLPWEDALTASGQPGAGGWTVEQLAEMGATKERCWREQIEGGAPPHLMPSYVADAYAYASSLPRGAPLDYGRLGSILARAGAAADPGTRAWQAKQAERKRRRGAGPDAAGAARAAAAGRGRFKAARRGSSDGWGGASLGACGGLLALLGGGGEE